MSLVAHRGVGEQNYGVIWIRNIQKGSLTAKKPNKLMG